MGKQFARAIVWSRWNIRIDNLGITCTEDIIISGSRATGPMGSYWIGTLGSLLASLILDAIWSLRNNMIHNDGKVNLITTLVKLEQDFYDHVIVMDSRIFLSM